MQFDKPKVTIDLDEYNWLKEQAAKFQTDDWYNAARMILFAFSPYNRRNGDVGEYLKINGIEFSFGHNGPTSMLNYQDVSINIKPKSIAK